MFELGSKVAISTDTAVGSIVNEGQIKPIMQLAYDAVTIPITPVKMAQMAM